MACSKPTCERPCAWECPREAAQAKTEWHRRRMRGIVQGPLELHWDMWARLVEGRNGGWPLGAENAETLQPDAVIG